MYLKYIFICISIFFSVAAYAQDDAKKKSNSSASGKMMKEVSRSLEQGESDVSIAQGYLKLAKELASEGEYAKSEDYLNRARKIYEKRKDKEKIAEIDRELAKTQEAQNKVTLAISNYQSANKLSKNKVTQSLNANDAGRLINKSKPEVQSKYIQSNLDIMEDADMKEDKAVAYQQMAEVNMVLDKKDEAITNLNKALINTVKPTETVKINREIANVYAAGNQHEKAIEINEKLLGEAKDMSPKAEIEQLQSLSSAYFDANNEEKGFESLQEAYVLAIEQGHTLDAKSSLELLVDRYKKEKKPLKALEIYDDFTKRLESLIKSDSTLVDAKAFQVHEERISQLEKERALKDELIEKKNIFNYGLLASIALILIFLILIAKALYSNKQKNKRIALQSLRREMNPHFIFNSLNSVNQFIAQNNELEANKYLSSYSKLMRNIMENSNKDFVPLSAELEQLKEYLDLEYMRFHDKFTYKIDIDNNIDTDAIFVPNMLIQPQLENAIWHGLRYKEANGLLMMNVRLEGKNILVIIDDNGIGLKKSQELKTKHQRTHQSRGMTNTHERIGLLNDLYKCDISINIMDKVGDETGVVVTLSFPLMVKNR